MSRILFCEHLDSLLAFASKTNFSLDLYAFVILNFNFFPVFFHMRHFGIDFLFIWFFLEMVFQVHSLSVFFLFFFSGNCFPNSLIVRNTSSLLFSRWKSVELYFRTSPAIFFNTLYLLISFFVLHKSRLSRLTSDLPHSLFQPNGF